MGARMPRHLLDREGAGLIVGALLEGDRQPAVVAVELFETQAHRPEAQLRSGLGAGLADPLAVHVGAVLRRQILHHQLAVAHQLETGVHPRYPGQG